MDNVENKTQNTETETEQGRVRRVARGTVRGVGSVLHGTGHWFSVHPHYFAGLAAVASVVALTALATMVTVVQCSEADMKKMIQALGK